jgi:erythromycin esterase-like protein
MRRTHRRAYGPLIACIASVALLQGGPVARAQEPTAQSIVDGVVDAVCQKQIVLLGELPSHGEAQAFDAKSKIADRLMAQCGFAAILFEAPIYDFIGLERAAKTRTATPEQLDNAIGRFWWTRELAPWRRALFEALTLPGVKNPVVVGGLDDQVSITSHYGHCPG